MKFKNENVINAEIQVKQCLNYYNKRFSYESFYILDSIKKFVVKSTERTFISVYKFEDNGSYNELIKSSIESEEFTIIFYDEFSEIQIYENDNQKFCLKLDYIISNGFQIDLS